MAKKERASSAPASHAVSLDRANRLHRLIRVLARGPQSRPSLLATLKVDVRTFYRDLELLRRCGIEVPVVDRKYQLTGTGRVPHAKAAIEHLVNRLPVPDPNFTLGEARTLAKGRTPVHRKLRKLIAAVTR